MANYHRNKRDSWVQMSFLKFTIGTLCHGYFIFTQEKIDWQCSVQRIKLLKKHFPANKKKMCHWNKLFFKSTSCTYRCFSLHNHRHYSELLLLKVHSLAYGSTDGIFGVRFFVITPLMNLTFVNVIYSSLLTCIFLETDIVMGFHQRLHDKILDVL